MKTFLPGTTWLRSICARLFGKRVDIESGVTLGYVWRGTLYIDKRARIP